MDYSALIKSRVAQYYWKEDINCATAVLRILSEVFDIELNHQVLAAATGMHGAGEYGAQCGLVEGSVMFLGIFAQHRGCPGSDTVAWSFEFAQAFEERFGSLRCSVLRPEGFAPSNPPHLCEPLTCRAVEFSLAFALGIEEKIGLHQSA
jgi:C_GCAxxG_C_C family probable redox protein